MWAFQKKLNTLGHFYTLYKNIDELKYKFNQQLDKLASDGFIAFTSDKTESHESTKTTIRDSKNVVTDSTISTGGDFIVGDNNTRK